MDKILSDFGVQPILLLAQVVNFLVLLFILKKLLYKPVLSMLEKRKALIAQSLKNAEEIEKKLAQTSEEEEKRILGAAREGEKIIKEAQDSAVALIEEGRAKAEDLYKQILEEAKDQVSAQKDKMMLEVRQELSGIISVALEKIMGNALDKNAQKKLVDDAVKTIKQ